MLISWSQLSKKSCLKSGDETVAGCDWALKTRGSRAWADADMLTALLYPFFMSHKRPFCKIRPTHGVYTCTRFRPSCICSASHWIKFIGFIIGFTLRFTLTFSFTFSFGLTIRFTISAQLQSWICLVTWETVDLKLFTPTLFLADSRSSKSSVNLHLLDWSWSCEAYLNQTLFETYPK